MFCLESRQITEQLCCGSDRGKHQLDVITGGINSIIDYNIAGQSLVLQEAHPTAGTQALPLMDTAGNPCPGSLGGSQVQRCPCWFMDEPHPTEHLSTPQAHLFGGCHRDL